MRFGHGYGQWLGGGFGGGRGEHHQFGHRERHGGGRRRMFDGGELRLVLLALLEEQPRHGYDLIRAIEERTGGDYAPSPGVVYPTLTLLDEMGLVEEVKEEGSRKRFAITDAGRAHVTEQRTQVDALLDRLASLGEQRARSDRSALRRAMASLHMAVRAGMVEGDDARAHAIVDVLDDATRRIERLDG